MFPSASLSRSARAQAPRSGSFRASFCTPKPAAIPPKRRRYCGAAKRLPCRGVVCSFRPFLKDRTGGGETDFSGPYPDAAEFLGVERLSDFAALRQRNGGGHLSSR